MNFSKGRGGTCVWLSASDSQLGGVGRYINLIPEGSLDSRPVGTDGLIEYTVSKVCASGNELSPACVYFKDAAEESYVHCERRPGLTRRKL